MVAMRLTASKPKSNWVYSTRIPASQPKKSVVNRLHPAKMAHFFVLRGLASIPLDNDSHWPPTGTLDFDVLRDLDNYCRRTEKWSKLPYVQAFWALRSHPTFAQPAPRPKLCSPWLLNGLPAQIQTPLPKNRQALCPLPSLFP